MKGIFRVVASEKDIVQNKGVRAFITEKILLDPTIKSGIAINLEDEKTVEVRLEGEKEAILKFIEKLKKDLISQFGNPIISISDFEENNFVEIPDAQRSGQALMLNQLQKGINVQLQILQSLGLQKDVFELQKETVNTQKEILHSVDMQKEILNETNNTQKEILNSQNEMSNTQKQMLKSQKETATTQKEMVGTQNDVLSTLREITLEMKNLPQNIAHALKN